MNFKVKCCNEYVDDFSLGKIYEVVSGKIIDDNGDARPISDTVFNSFEELVCFYPDSFELVEEEMEQNEPKSEFTLRDLKPFMLVERRKGDLLLVAENKHTMCLIGEDFSCSCSMSDYDLNLKNKYNYDKDIMKVYDLSESYSSYFDVNLRTLLFDRFKEVHISLKEIKEKFNLDEDAIVVID